MLFELDPTLTAEQVATIIETTAISTEGGSAPRLDALSLLLKLKRSAEYLVDINEDGILDEKDIARFKEYCTEYKSRGHSSAPFDWRTIDLVGNGIIDTADVLFMRELWPSGADAFDELAKKIDLLP
jgi:hypothetical protein